MTKIMVKAALALCLGLAGFASGCGGGDSADTSTRLGACKGLVHATCEFYFRCVPAGQGDPTTYGTTESECESTTYLGTQCEGDLTEGCQTFSSSLASMCISQINSTTCANAADLDNSDACNNACQ
ncbi:MAG TPA: hypothetical protein VHJ20_16200 [Polyangia bacterium]|nr:hypothetical protein [Polyangia bacterium]